MPEETTEQCKKRWSKEAEKTLKGRTIESVSYLSDEEANNLGWHQSAIVIQLDDIVIQLELFRWTIL